MSSEQEHDEAEIRALREAFEAGLAEVDELDRARLRRARREALKQPREALPLPRPARWQVPVALAASLGLLSLMLLPMLNGGPDQTIESDWAEARNDVSDLEILLAEEDMTLYADLDFYLWLEAELSAREDAKDAG
ncbi:hypothetical protein VCB98_10285 [Gammaproteobacteria bacterium AB-CW1]|uniref:DUF3619 family protein n=1 Tax=Natronospira elongata TaxID=3110268 RepID=A0AAP6JGI4_9GAMM|nr:hypothetical protein [Gammaproteobacteria bacterium AB-CW1]